MFFQGKARRGNKKPLPRDGRRGFRKKDRVLLHMRRDELGHLEHGDLGLPAEDRLEERVGVDVALVLGVLEIVFFDVVPDFLGELAAGERGGADNGRENGVRLNGFEEGGIDFAFRFGSSWHVGWFLLVATP
jgi:hypothetical protein